MRPNRLGAWMVVIGMLLVLGSMGLISSVIAEWEQAGGTHRKDKLVLNVDATQSHAEGVQLLAAERLVKRWYPQRAAYAAEDQEKLVAGSSSVGSDIFGVSGNYSQFISFPMKSGTSITAKAVEDHSRVAVLSEGTADKLFGSGTVVGKQIELYGAKFTIIGVYAELDSLLRRLGDEGIDDVWIPVTAMMDLQKDVMIRQIQLAVNPDKAVRAEADAVNALRAEGINPVQFRIHNEVLAHRELAQLSKLLLFGCGFAAIYLLVRIILRLWHVQIATIRHRHRTEDLRDIIRHQRYKLLACLLASAAMAACAAWIWLQIRFRFYIAADWLPEELIQVSFYIERLIHVWEQQAVQAGYIPTPQERLTAAAGMLSWRGLLVGACGVPIFWMGLRWLGVRRVPLAVQLQLISLMLPAAAAMIYAFVRLAGLDYRIDLIEYAVVGAFMLAFVVYIHYSKGVTYHEVFNES